MNKYLIGLIVVLLILVIVGGVVYRTGRWSVEQAKYVKIRTEGRFEFRQYPTLRWVTAPMQSETGTPFRKLFAYITGENQQSQKIAMTTPVWMQKNDGESLMAFGVAEAIQTTEIPSPRAVDVKVVMIPGGTFAVYSDQGIDMTSESLVEELKKELRSLNYVFEERPIYAFYDPPWIPRWLSRKEILWRVIETPKNE